MMMSFCCRVCQTVNESLWVGLRMDGCAFVLLLWVPTILAYYKSFFSVVTTVPLDSTGLP